MKKIMMLSLYCLTLQICFAQNNDNENWDEEELGLSMPTIGAIILPMKQHALMTDLKAKGYQKVSNINSLANIGFIYKINRRLQTELQVSFTSGDTMKMDKKAIIQKSYRTNAMIGYNIKKNKIMERWNMIGNVGIYASSDKQIANSIIANYNNQTFSYKELENWKTVDYGLTSSIKLQARPINFFMLSVLTLGTEIGYQYSLSSADIKNNKEGNSPKKLARNNSSTYYYSFYATFNLPLYIKFGKNSKKVKR